jgi:Helicase subunit of the DNA excision repair complex
VKWRELVFPAVLCVVAEFFLDAEKLVVFCKAVGAGHRAGLDLAAVGCDCEICEGGVLGFARAVGSDSGVMVAVSELDGVQSLGQGADLVQLDQDAVSATHLDALFKILDVGDEEVVADELDFLAEFLGEELPAVPIAFGHAVLDGIDRVFAGEFLQVCNLILGTALCSLRAFEMSVVVNSVNVKFACCAVHDITPHQIETRSKNILYAASDDEPATPEEGARVLMNDPVISLMNPKQLLDAIKASQKRMEDAAAELDFVTAAKARDEMNALKNILDAK